MFRLLFQRLSMPGSFLAPVLILVSGTALAHGITAAALSILTRIYSPDDFGALGLFSGIIYTLSVAACLRFDVAITLADDDYEATGLFGLAIFSSLSTSLMMGLVIVAIPNQCIVDAGLGSIASFLWIIPPGMFLIGVYSALQNWFVRKKSFGLISRTRIIQSISAAITQIGLGVMSSSSLWLIIGFVMNSGSAAMILMFNYMRQITRAQNISWRKLLPQMFRKYGAFPKYSIWEAMANSGSIQIPIIVIGALTSPKEVGYLILAMSVIQMPMALFGTAAAQVFASQAPAKARKGELKSFTMDTLKGLAMTGGIPLLLLGAVSPFAFPIFFGAEWVRSGMLVAWMVPWLLLQFLASPVSLVLYITQNQRLAFILQFSGLAFRVICVYVGATLTSFGASEAYALSGAVFYGIYLFLIHKMASKVVL